MKSFIALALAFVLALPFNMAVPVAGFARPLYDAFCPGGATLPVLTHRMEDSIAADPSGHKKLAGCHADPVQFLYAFQQADPDGAPKDVAGIVRYMREDLEKTTIDRSIKWTSSCIRGESPTADDVIMDCQVDTIGPTVEVYRDKRTHRLVFKSDCANPGLVPAVKSPCAYIEFRTVVPGSRIHVPIYGSATDDRCYGWRTGMFENGVFTSTSDWHDIVPGCLDQLPGCNYNSADERAAPRTRTFDGTIDVPNPGYVEIRVSTRFAESSDTALGLCLEIPNSAGFRRTSFIGWVESEYFATMPNGERVAEVFYTNQDEQAAGVSDPRHERFFWWSH